jgi:hypothetical protein
MRDATVGALDKCCCFNGVTEQSCVKVALTAFGGREEEKKLKLKLTTD